MLQEELDDTALEWNCHKISAQRNTNCETGKPITMYEIPHLYAAMDYIQHIRDRQILAACRFLNLPCDKDIYELCNIIMQEKNLQLSDDPYCNIDVYIELKNEINILMI